MNERERLVAVLEGGTPDRTPWYGDLSWWHTAHCEAGDLPDEYARGDRGYLKMHADAGVGIYLYAPMLWTQAYDASVTETVTVAGTATISTLSTPVGRVRSVTAGLPGSATSAIVEHYVKVPDDLHVMQYAWTHRTVAPNYAAFRSCDDLWGDQGMACALAPIATTALQTLMTRWAGVETTVRLWAYAREDLERTIGVVQEADDAVFDLICAGPGRCVAFPENLSGEVTGRRLLRDYAMPYWRRRIGQLHAAGKRVGIHNDGTLRGSLPLLIEAGFDFVEAATPAPVGDMTPAEIRHMTEGRITVWGCLPGALFSPTTPEGVFISFVEEVLGTFRGNARFVLGVADQVPPDASFDRIALVRRILDRVG